MKRLIWAPQALDDLADLILYHSQQDVDLAFDRAQRIEEAPLVLLDHPLLGRRLPDSDVRIWRARQTPYLLFYRPLGDEVRILKLVHGATDWKPRG